MTPTSFIWGRGTWRWDSMNRVYRGTPQSHHSRIEALDVSHLQEDTMLLPPFHQSILLDVDGDWLFNQNRNTVLDTPPIPNGGWWELPH